MQAASDIEYVEEFRRLYRKGYKDFVRSDSAYDMELVGKALMSMEQYELEKRIHENAEGTERLSFTEALQQVPRGLLGGKDIGKANELLMEDEMKRGGSNIDIAAHAFKITLDMARSRELIRDTENVARKFEDCMGKNTDLQRQLHDAQQRIVRLETMIRVLGRNPDEASSYSTNVQGNGDSHE